MPGSTIEQVFVVGNKKKARETADFLAKLVSPFEGKLNTAADTVNLASAWRLTFAGTQNIG